MEMTSRTDVPERRTLIGLFSDLWRETSALFRAEAELAKAELSEKVTQIQTAIISLAVGGAILLAAILFLLDAVVNGLDAPELVIELDDGVSLALSDFVL